VSPENLIIELIWQWWGRTRGLEKCPRIFLVFSRIYLCVPYWDNCGIFFGGYSRI